MSKHYPQKKVIAVLPAYNAERTLEATLESMDMDWIDEIILVDDASQDQTVEQAKQLGLNNIFVHSRNMGYGANQKTCYQQALKLDADIVIMIHPDHQYDPKYVPEMLLPIIRGDADAVFGSRMMMPGGARAGGMPWWKYLANIFLTKIENLVLRKKLTEYHSGLRAYATQFLKQANLNANSNNFVFDTEIIVQLKVWKKKIKEIPIHTKYFPEAHMVGFFRGVKYGLDILRVMWEYMWFRLGLREDKRFMKNENS